MTKNSTVSFFEIKLDKLAKLPDKRLFFAQRHTAIKAGIVVARWRLITILSGERLYRFSENGQEVTRKLKTGDILLAEPFSSIWCEEDQSYDMLSLVQDTNAIRFVSKQRIKGVIRAENPDFVLHRGMLEVKCFVHLLESLAAYIKQSSRPNIDPLLQFLWAECLAAIRSEHSIARSEPQYLLEKIIYFISDHLTEDINCSRLANEFGVSVNYVAQLFARGMFCGFSEYVRMQRLELSCELLRNSKMNIGEIADYCGFNQPNYFIKIFKKKYGETPLNYRIKVNSK